MAPPTPQNGSITRLLQGLNSGLNNLVRRGGPNVEKDASSDEEDRHNQTSTDDVRLSTVDNNVDSTTNKDDLVETAQESGANTMAESQDKAAAVATTNMDSKEKKKKDAPDHGKRSKKTNAKRNNNDKKADPPRKKLPNLLEMEEAFEHGYDSDGWEGPPRGTDDDEVNQLNEESLDEMCTTAVAVGTVDTSGSDNQPTPAPVHIDEETLNKLTVAMLKSELISRKVPLKGLASKPKLQACLREALSQKLPVYSAAALESEQKKNKINKRKEDDMSAFAIGAKWRVLEADVDVDEPINANFPLARAPTVEEKDAAIQQKPKKSFSETFDRPVFSGRINRRVSYVKADGTTGYRDISTLRKEGRPNPTFLRSHGLNKESLPVEFAESFFPMYENTERDGNGDAMLSMEYLARNTNLRAQLAFAGEATYTDWSGPFSIKELRQHLGLYIMNGLSPSPGLHRKFDEKDAANYNPFLARNFGKQACRRVRQFRAFFSCQDPLKATPNRDDSPLFKVLPIIKWIQRVGPLSWECGIDLGLDEQTMGFQGLHVDKMRITYNKEGDGFQCDALCDNGFTCSVFFRNEKPPTKYIRMGFSPLHARSMWLFDQLNDQFHRVWMDNLYISAKFTKGAWHLSEQKVITAGVCRTKDRGLPQCVIQEAVDKASLATTRGAIKAAALEGDPDCKDLVALSIYDTKPVHFLTMAAETIEWVEKKRNVWNKAKREMQLISFLRVNVNDDYNNKMNSVDIADQLRNNYRVDHWLRFRKWWWSIFLWGFGVLLTNAYLVYCRVQEEAGVPKKDWMTHYDFLLSIATAWVDSNETDIRCLRRIRQKKRKQLEEMTADTTPSPPKRVRPSNRITKSPKTGTIKRTKAPRVSDHSLHPTSGLLRCRLDHVGHFHCPEESDCNVPSCSLHRWIYGREDGTGSQIRDKVFKCSVCLVNLCISCFKTFHTVDDLIAKKNECLQGEDS